MVEGLPKYPTSEIRPRSADPDLTSDKINQLFEERAKVGRILSQMLIDHEVTAEEYLNTFHGRN